MSQEIYYGTKTKHFRAVHKASGIPYRDMLFFDNGERQIYFAPPAAFLLQTCTVCTAGCACGLGQQRAVKLLSSECAAVRRDAELP